MSRRALVLGGTGAVGSAVVARLAERGVPTTFTYCHSKEKADALTAEHGARAIQLDLTDVTRVGTLIDRLASDGGAPDVAIHCAAMSSNLALADIDHPAWTAVQSVNAYSAFRLCQSLAPYLAQNGGGDVVLVGALDRAQSLPIPIHFAASQGMLSAMTMALARELGPIGVRINMVALGPLTDGLSRSLAPQLIAEYEGLSALRRLGSADEVSRAIAWLALENTYMDGKVLSVNGGI